MAAKILNKIADRPLQADVFVLADDSQKRNDSTVRFTKGNDTLMKGESIKVHRLINPTYCEPE